MQQIKNKRVTIIKHLVGKVRSPGYSLPGDRDESFAYGIRNKADEEGAGKVIQSWVEESEPTKQNEIKCFPATNSMALHHGFDLGFHPEKFLHFEHFMMVHLVALRS
jgi:hypothetical protein